MDITKSSPLSRLFGGGSPFEALSEHIRQVDRGADLLINFFQASSDGDWDRARGLYREISDCEHTADDLKDRIRLNLPNTLFLPISRSDLLELVEAQDKIINKIKDIAGLMTGRRMQFPAVLLSSINDYIQVTIDTVHQAREVLEELDELLESGFGRNISEVIEDMVVELGKLEKRADEEQVAIRHRLLEQEAELPPLEVIFLYQIIDWIGTVSDRAERVGSRLQIMMAR
ncbi:MAG TPA: TIGR00153 family protein [Salinisphaera sp.]|nr:TIGR00153 family protein [Salinisphaera sp.]HET7313819.1 TIGR00153 family protein [Salinisphaera sp.]